MDNKKKVYLSIGVIGALVLVVGISYAIWTFNIAQEGVNTITSGCLRLTLTDETDAINLTKAQPTTDAEASKLDPYTFKIENTCSNDVNYNISLEMMDTTDRLLTQYIAVSIDNKTKSILNTLEETELTYSGNDYTPVEGRMLVSGSLKANASISHSLRLWMDESTPAIDATMNKTFLAKVVLNASIKPVITNLAEYIIDASKTDETIVEMNQPATEQTPALKDYRYVGANPNNYVCLEESGECTDNQLYRVIGVIPTQSTEDGEYEDRVRLIKATSYGSIAWASDNVNDWEASSLKNTLNTTYWESISSYQKYIEDTKWNLGGHSTQVAPASTFYVAERSNTVYSGRPTSTIAKIGLMYPSDYGYAVGGEVRATCIGANLSNYNTNNCYTNDWLYMSGFSQWTVSPRSTNTSNVFRVYIEGYLHNNSAHDGSAVRPVFSLKSNIGILSGEGTKEQPWLLKSAS